MSQLLKHYLINRDTGDYALTVPSGYMGVNLPGIQGVYTLFDDERGVPYCLSTVPDEIDGEPYVVPQTQGEGMKVITQQEWDDEIAAFDARQTQKRYDILRTIRDRILQLTDWIVIKDLEQQETISQEFKTWRQALRDLPSQNPFPTGFPTLPTELENHIEIQQLYSRFGEVRSIYMLNDPLPPLDRETPAPTPEPTPTLPGQ
jgi:hypothetical protein